MSRDRIVLGPRRVLRPLRRLVRGKLRLRVLLAALSVALVALVGFDVAAVIALRGYLMNQTDTALITTAQTAQPSLLDLPYGPLGTKQGLTKAGWEWTTCCGWPASTSIPSSSRSRWN